MIWLLILYIIGYVVTFPSMLARTVHVVAGHTSFREWAAPDWGFGIFLTMITNLFWPVWQLAFLLTPYVKHVGERFASGDNADRIFYPGARALRKTWTKEITAARKAAKERDVARSKYEFMLNDLQTREEELSARETAVTVRENDIYQYKNKLQQGPQQQDEADDLSVLLRPRATPTEKPTPTA